MATNQDNPLICADVRALRGWRKDSLANFYPAAIIPKRQRCLFYNSANNEPDIFGGDTVDSPPKEPRILEDLADVFREVPLVGGFGLAAWGGPLSVVCV